MGALIGLIFGIGVLMMLTAGDAPRRRRAPRPRIRLRLVAVSLGTALVAGLIALVVTGVPAIAAVAAGSAAFVPRALAAGAERRRRREQAEAWPDVVDHLASAIRAGLSLPEAVVGLSIHGPQQLREPFTAFARDYEASGRFLESLDRLKGRLADPTGDRVVEALRLARDVGGGDLGRMLRSLSVFLREDARTRAELEARQSWTVAGARLAVAAPWIVLLMMSGQRDVIARFGEPAGMLVLVAGAAACVVAYRLMRWAGRLPLEERVLA